MSNCKIAVAALGMLVLGDADALAAGGAGGNGSGICTTTSCSCYPYPTGGQSTENLNPNDPSKPILSVAFANDPSFNSAFHIISDAYALPGAKGPDIHATGTPVMNKKRTKQIGWGAPWSNVSIPSNTILCFIPGDPVSKIETVSNYYTAFIPEIDGTTAVISGYIIPNTLPDLKICNTKGLPALIDAKIPSCI